MLHKANAKFLTLICASLLLAFPAQAKDANCAAWLDHDIKQLHSKNVHDLCALTQNKTVLLVNTASHCGYTRQFSGLEKLHSQYSDKGLVVIGFPSNSFNQEAKSEKDTARVCYKNFGVTFAMTQTISVRGDNAHPVFQHLTKQTSAPSWNFNKFLVNSKGEVVKKFSSSVEPNSLVMTVEVERALYSF